MTEEMRNKIEELTWDYEFVGVRIQGEEFELGEIDHVSSVWVDGEELEEKLDGICAVRIGSAEEAEAIIEKATKAYFGDHIAIICGQSAEYGEDEGEIIISDASCELIIA